MQSRPQDPTELRARPPGGGQPPGGRVARPSCPSLPLRPRTAGATKLYPGGSNAASTTQVVSESATIPESQFTRAPLTAHPVAHSLSTWPPALAFQEVRVADAAALGHADDGPEGAPGGSTRPRRQENTTRLRRLRQQQLFQRSSTRDNSQGPTGTPTLHSAAHASRYAAQFASIMVRPKPHTET